MKLHLPISLRQILLASLLVCSTTAEAVTQLIGDDAVTLDFDSPCFLIEEKENEEEEKGSALDSAPWLTFAAAPYNNFSVSTSNPALSTAYSNIAGLNTAITTNGAGGLFDTRYATVKNIYKINSAYQNNSSTASGHYFADDTVIRKANDTIMYGERFYDTHKGYAFVYFQNPQDNNAIYYNSSATEYFESIYKNQGSSFTFLGNTLYNYIPSNLRNASFSTVIRNRTFAGKFGDDMLTCWRQSNANQLQYWTSFYGVFNNSGKPMPYGYTYRPDLLQDMMGVNSLEISMLLHESQLVDAGSTGFSYWVNDSTRQMATGSDMDGCMWFLYGGDGMKNKALANKFGWEGVSDLINPNTAPGFFRKYISSPDSVCESREITTQADLNKAIKSAFSKPGQIASLCYGQGYSGSGHVVTCYGYEQDSKGNVTGVWIADNEDFNYGLKFISLGVADVVTGTWSEVYQMWFLSPQTAKPAIMMYDDAKHTQIYSGLTQCFVTSISWIDTPQCLVDMYEEYQDKDNPLVWNGKKANGKWQHAGTETAATVDALPTEATGWVVNCESGAPYGQTYFPSYYSAGRGVMFDDYSFSGYATIQEVTLAGGSTVTAGDMFIDSGKTYEFTSLSGTKLSVGNFSKSGSGMAQFRSVPLSFKAATLNGGELRLNGGNTFTGTGSMVLNKGAELSFYGQNTLTLSGALTFNAGSSLFADSGSTGSYSTVKASKVSFANDATISLQLGEENQKIPVLTLNSSLTLNSGTLFDITREMGLTGDKSYYLFKVNSLPSASLLSGFDVPYGTLTFNGGYLVYNYEGVMQWGDEDGTWSSNKWNSTSASCTGKNVEFYNESRKARTVTVQGKVSPESIIVNGGSYIFKPYSSSSSNAISGVKQLEVGASASLTTYMPIEAQVITLRDGADFWVQTDRNWDIKKLNLARSDNSDYPATMYVGTAEGTTLRVLDSDYINGKISLQGSSQIEFRFDHSFTLGGDITSPSLSSKACFTNRSSTNDITYSIDLSPDEHRQWYVIGSESDSHYTTLELTSFKGYSEPSFEITSKGILSLNFVSTANVAPTTGGIKGSGTVLVPKGASVVMSSDSNHQLPLLSTISLDVRGNATLGSHKISTSGLGSQTITDYGIQGEYASGVAVSGSLLVNQKGASSITLPSLTLKDGGTYTVNTHRLTAASKGLMRHDIGEVTVSGEGGTIYHTEEQDTLAYGEEATVFNIGNLRGIGDLTLKSETKGTLTVYQLGGNKNNAFTGNLILDSRNSDYVFTYYYRMAALELGTGQYGTVTAKSESLIAHAAIGIAGDVTLDGLISDSTTAYLISGTVNSSKALEKEDNLPPANFILREHNLNLDVASGKSYSFSGSVHGPLNLVKKGSGMQRFTGSFSAFSGDIDVQSGTLDITSSFSTPELTLAKGGTLLGGNAVQAGKAALSGGLLEAKSITLNNVNVSGTGSSLIADTIVLSDINFVLSDTQGSTPMLTLQSLGSSGKLTFSTNDLSFEWAAGSSKKVGAYKLLQYSSDFGGYLSGLSTSNEEYMKKGTSGYYVEKSTLKGETIYTLSYYYNLVKRKATSLNWIKNSGIWQDCTGNDEGVWSGSVKDLSFYNGDDVNFSAAASVTIAGNVTPNSVCVSNSSGTVHYYAGSNGGAITGATALTKTGSGTLNIHNSNTYTGGTIIKEGTVIAGTDGALGKGQVELAGGTLQTTTLNNDVLVSNSSKLNAYQTSTLALNGTLTMKGGTLSGSTLQLNKGAVLQGGTISNALSGTGGITVEGYATLNGANTYTGDTIVKSGQLTLNSSSQKSDLIMNGGSMSSSYTQSFTGGRTLTLNGGTVKSNVTLGSNGLLELKKNGTITGTLTLSGGTLNLGANTLDVNGTLKLNASTTLSFTGINTPGTYRLINYNSLSGSLSYLVLPEPETSRYTYKLGTASNYVTLTITSSATTVYWNGGQGTWRHGFQASWQDADGQGTGSLQFLNGDTVVFNAGGSVQIAGDVTPAALTISGSEHLQLSGSGRITGSSRLTKNGTGEAVLNAENTYTGGTLVQGGSLVAGGSKSFGTGSITVSSGARLDLGNYAVANNISLNGGTFAGSGFTGRLTTTGASKLGEYTSGIIYMSSGSLSEGSITNSTITADQGTINTPIMGTSSLSKETTGALYLYGDNTYTGGTNVKAGTLYANHANAMGYGDVSLQAGAALHLAGYAIDNDVTSYGGTFTGSAYTGKLTVAGNTTLSGTVTADRILMTKGDLSGGTISNTDIEGRVSTGAPLISSTLSGDGDITLYSGTLGISASAANKNYTGDIYVKGGILYLTGPLGCYSDELGLGTGTIYLEGGTLQWEDAPKIYNNVVISGNARVNGSAFYGNLTLTSGSVDTWFIQNQADLYEGTIGNLQNNQQGEVYKKGKGTVQLNAGAGGSSGSKLYVEEGNLVVNSGFTPANHVFMKGGTLTLQQDVSTAYTQTYHLAEGIIKGNLIHAGSNSIIYGGEGAIHGNLTLAGGMISTAEGHPVVVTGTLTLQSKSLLDFSNIREDGTYEFIRYGKLSGSTSGMFAAYEGESERGKYTFSMEDGSLWVHFTRTAATLNWTASSGIWAEGSTGDDWDISSSDKKFYAGDKVVFSNGGSTTVTGYVAPGEITVSGSKDFTFIGNGTITGELTLTKTGTGTLTMSSTNNYSGTTIINSGVVKAAEEDYSYDQTNNSFGASTIELRGGTLDLVGQPIGNNINVTGNASLKNGENYFGSLTVDNATLSGNNITVSREMEISNGTIQNNLSGSGDVTVMGKVVLSGTNTLYGHTLVMVDIPSSTQGHLTAQNTTLKGDVSIWGGTLVLGSGKTLTMEKGKTLEINGGHLQANLALQAGSQLNNLGYGCKVSGSVTLNGGALQLSASTYEDEDACMVIGGNLNINGPTTLALKDFSYYGNSTHTLARYADLKGSLSQVQLYFNESGRTKGTLVDTGTSLILTVSGGAEDIYWKAGSGKWKEAAAGAWFMTEDNSRSSFMRGDNVTFNNGGTVSISGEVRPGSITIAESGNLKFTGSGCIAGETDLIMRGYDTLTMNATNIYSGGTDIYDGVVVAGGAKSFGTGVIILNGGTLNLGKHAVKNDIYANYGILKGTAYAGTLEMTLGHLELQGTFRAKEIILGDKQHAHYIPTLEGGIINNTPITSFHSTIGSQIKGTSSLTVGTLTEEELGDDEHDEFNENYTVLTGNNSYTGGTVVMDGIVSPMHINALGTGNVTIYNGGINMNNLAIANDLNIRGYAFVENAGNYQGRLQLDGGCIDGGILHLNATMEHTLSSGSILSGLKGGTLTSLEGSQLQIMKTGSGTVYLDGDYSELYSHTQIHDGTLEIAGSWSSHLTLHKGTLHAKNLQLKSNTLNLKGGKLEGSYSLSGSGSIGIHSDMELNGSLTLNGGRIDWADVYKLDINGSLNLTGKTTLHMGSNFTKGVYELLEFDELQGSLTLLNVTGNDTRRSFSVYEEDYKLYLKVDGVNSEHLWTSGGSKVWANGTNFGFSRADVYMDGDAITFSAGGTIKLNETVVPADVEVTGSKNLTIQGSGHITGESALTKNGTGTLTISNTNAYSGGTVINEGTIIAGNKNAFGLGDITLRSGATLNLKKQAVNNDIYATGGTLSNAQKFEGQLTVAGGVNIASSTQLQANKITLQSGSLMGGSIKDTDIELNGGSLYTPLSGDCSISVNGTVFLSGANKHTGSTQLYSGKLTLGHDKALGTGRVELHGGTLDLGNRTISNSLVSMGDVTLSNMNGFSGQLIVENGKLSASSIRLQQDLILTGGEVAARLTGTGGVNVQGNAILSGDNTYTGLTNIMGGNLQLTGSVVSDVRISGGSLTTAAGGMLLHNGQNLTLENGSINGKVTVLSTGSLTLTDTSAQSFDLILGGGKLILPGGNINHAGELFITAESTLVIGTGYGYGTHTLLTTNSISNEEKQLLTLESNATAGRAYSLEWIGNDLVLNVEKCNKTVRWNGKSSGLWAMDGETNWDADGEAAFFESEDSVLFNNNGTMKVSGIMEVSELKVDNTKTLTFTAASKKTPCSISGFGSVIKQGKGTLNLNLANSYTGGTYIHEGTLAVGNNNALGSGDIFLYAGTLNLGNKSIKNHIHLLGDAVISKGGKFAGDFTMEGNLLKGSSLNIAEGHSATVNSGNIGGTITGSGTVKIAGTVTLNGGKITTALLAIDGHSAQLDASTTKGLAMAKTSNLLIQNGATLNSAGAVTAGNLSMHNATLNASNATARALTIYDDVQIFHNSTVTMYGGLTADNIEISDSQLLNGLADEYRNEKNKEKAQTLTAKGHMLLSNSEVTHNGAVKVTKALEMADGASLTLAGSLTAATLSLSDADLTLGNSTTAQKITLKQSKATNSLFNANLNANASMTVSGSLEMKDSTLSLRDASTRKKAQSLTVKGALNIEDSIYDSETELSLTGKLTAGSIDINKADIDMSAAASAQAVTVTREIEMQDARMRVYGSVTAADILLKQNAHLHVYDPVLNKAQNITAKGSLVLGKGSSLTLSGKLKAKNLILDGGTLNLTSSTLQTITVSGTLTLNSRVDFNLGADLKVGKAVNIFTYKNISLGGDGDLYSLLGLDDDYCTLTLNTKSKAITLTVTDAAQWLQYRKECLNPVAMVTADPVTTANTGSTETANADEEVMQNGQNTVTNNASVAEYGSSALTDEATTTAANNTLELALPAVVMNKEIKAAIDTVVQSQWATAESSRTFQKSIASRSLNTVYLPEGHAAAWVAALGSQSRLSSSNGHAGSNTSSSGAVFGIEWFGGSSSAIGLAAGYSRGKVSTGSASSNKQDTTHVGLYGQSNLWENRGQMLSLQWSTLYGFVKNDTTLAMDDCEWEQNVLQLDTRITFAHALSESSSFNTYAGAEYLCLDSTEATPGVESEGLQNLRLEAGVGLSHRVNSKFSIYGEAAIVSDVFRNNPEADILGNKTQGSNPGRIGFDVGLGIGYQLSDKWTLHANYNHNRMQNSTSHNFNAGASYHF